MIRTTFKICKIDNLHAYYDGNQLQRVEDNISEDGNGNVNGNNNGMHCMYLFPGGYCNLNDPTETGTGDPGTDSISYHYYNKDHLGNNREVISENGVIEQVVHYYPFGTPFTDGSSTNIGLQPYLYGNKELDMMHGLNIYDFGARNYNPLLPMWDRMDPMCEKYYDVNPYVYCHSNPLSFCDPNGTDDYYSNSGRYVGSINNGTDSIMICSYSISIGYHEGEITIYDGKTIKDFDLSAEFYSNIFTDILSKMDEVDINELHNSKVSVMTTEQETNWPIITDMYNEPSILEKANASIGNCNGRQKLTAFVRKEYSNNNKFMYTTKSNIENLLGAHEYLGHFVNNIDGSIPNHINVYVYQMTHPSWKNTTKEYKDYQLVVLNNLIHSYFK